MLAGRNWVPKGQGFVCFNIFFGWRREREEARKEQSSAMRRLQEAEGRSDELAQALATSTRPLLRQIEALQQSLAGQRVAHEKSERALQERLGNRLQSISAGLIHQMWNDYLETIETNRDLEWPSTAACLESVENRRIEWQFEMNSKTHVQTCSIWRKNQVRMAKENISQHERKSRPAGGRWRRRNDDGPVVGAGEALEQLRSASEKEAAAGGLFLGAEAKRTQLLEQLAQTTQQHDLALQQLAAQRIRSRISFARLKPVLTS